MADKNQLKASQIDFADDDPFAELTRIMGFDPREPVRKPAQPAPQQVAPQQVAQPRNPTYGSPSYGTAPAPAQSQPAEEDFSLDLEKELLGGLDFDDEPSQPVVAAPEFDGLRLPPADEPDFDFSADFDVAMASDDFGTPSFDRQSAAAASGFETELEQAAPVVAPAPAEDDFDLGLSDADLGSLGDFAAAPAAQHDDSHIDLDLDAALSNLDMDRAPQARADAVPVAAAAQAEADDLDFGFFDDADFQLADEDAPQAAADIAPEIDGPAADLPDVAGEPVFELTAEAEPEIDEAAFRFGDDDFRFEDLPAPELPAIEEPVAAVEPEAEEQPEELSFEDDLDFGADFADDETPDEEPAAPALEMEAPEPVVETVPEPKGPQPFEFAVPAFVPRKLPTSPMDLAAEEFRQRETAPAPEFNLEDELNALLGNSKPKAPEPVQAAPAVLPSAPALPSTPAAVSFEPSLGPSFQPSLAPAYAPKPLAPQAPVAFDAPEHPVELDDNLDWNLDDTFAAEAAPEAVEEYQPAYEEPAYEEPAFEPAAYQIEEEIALNLDDVLDDLKEDSRQPVPAPFYRDAFAGAMAGVAASSAARYGSDFSAKPLELGSVSRSTGYGAPQPAYAAAAPASSHRDPVVRGNPLKEDPLTAINQLAERYARQDQGYGRPAAAGSRYRDEVEDDLDISYDFEDQPEIDTIEVSDRAVALADDFDIPELPEEDNTVPQAAAYDDLDAEFSSLLHELKSAPQAAQPVRGYDDPLAGGFRTQPYQSAAAPAQSQRPTASAVPPRGHAPEPDAFSLDMGDFSGNGQNYGNQNYGAEDFQFDNEFDQDIADGYAADEDARRPVSRKLLIGGLIAGVALIGGLGAFAFSFGGGGDSAPQLVRAEDGPVKVRPENPGGAIVPNQENQVYQSTSGEGSANAPRQENLVTTAEEPRDVTPPPENSAISGKSEDRIGQIVQDAEGQSDAELAAVAPRRVRTMVVRPDGTLVEREDPGTSNEQTDAIPAAPAMEGIPGAGQDVPALAPIPGETRVAAARPTSSGTTASTPATAPVAPTRPAAQPLDVVGEVAPTQVAAATAAAAGSWAMQIASQPSEAAAQSSYQDLARRYGSVLQGREVNVVRADIAGKGTFWRVRVPAPTRAEAVTLCEQYKVAGGTCFVSR